MTEFPDDFSDALPSRRIEQLAQAIGRTLVDVRRLVNLLPDENEPEEERRTYFSRISGTTEFVFDGRISHRFDIWSLESSVVVVDEPLVPYDGMDVVSLARDAHADPRLKACLGLRCEDVRIWTAREDFESPEKLEAGVSYRLTGGHELIYCAFLESELSDDLLLPLEDLPRRRVQSCFSVGERAVVRG